MIPIQMQERYDCIAEMLKPAYVSLHPAYYEVCLEALEELCCIRPSPLLRGSAVVWAGAILHAVCHTNLLFHPLTRGHRTPREVLAPLGGNPGTAESKSLQVRKLLHMDQSSAQWMRPALEEGNPRVWWISLKGGPMIDIRTKPLQVQLTAVQMGLIPVAPALMAEVRKQMKKETYAGKTMKP